MLTQKQISTNQVTMGQVHLLFSFEQPMMKVKNFLQFPLQATSHKKRLVPLPAKYTSVKDLYPAQFKNELWAHASSGYMSPTEFSSYDTAVTEELQWLTVYAENLSSELVNQNVSPPGWPAHRASQKHGIQTPLGINTILPLLRDKVSTFNMQAHLMQLNMKWNAC